jgi:hypothetical protein
MPLGWSAASPEGSASIYMTPAMTAEPLSPLQGWHSILSTLAKSEVALARSGVGCAHIGDARCIPGTAVILEITRVSCAAGRGMRGGGMFVSLQRKNNCCLGWSAPLGDSSSGGRSGGIE